MAATLERPGQRSGIRQKRNFSTVSLTNSVVIVAPPGLYRRPQLPARGPGSVSARHDTVITDQLEVVGRVAKLADAREHASRGRIGPRAGLWPRGGGSSIAPRLADVEVLQRRYDPPGWEAPHTAQIDRQRG
jgi:hypothetical protein